MKLTYRIRALAACTALLAVAAGCKKKEAAPPPPPPAAEAPPPPPAPAAVGGIDLGRAIDGTKKVTEVLTAFGKRDTIYASVATTGVGTGTKIDAKWTYQGGQTVNESSITVDLSGPALHEFHIAKKTAWPAGTYKVEVSLNGTPSGSKEFTIK